MFTMLFRAFDKGYIVYLSTKKNNIDDFLNILAICYNKHFYYFDNSNLNVSINTDDN